MGPSNVQINKAIDRAWNRTESAALDMIYAEVVPVVRADERRRIVEELRAWRGYREPDPNVLFSAVIEFIENGGISVEKPPERGE